MVMSFRYKSINRPDGSKIKTPSIPVLLSHKEKFETIALLDSGADFSAIPKGVAEILGISLEGKKEPTHGIGGKAETIKATINISIEKDHEHYSFPIHVSIILSEEYNIPVILGREGFFNEFIISFNQSEEKVTLKKINKKHFL
ncbi:MAG TPA: hypothetical protein VJH95_03300 [Candidatus Nanoarchaeia archaeon]|nr:hypothetical protein [Candidatus Nanoarchaeia archaeon]